MPASISGQRDPAWPRAHALFPAVLYESFESTLPKLTAPAINVLPAPPKTAPTLI